MKVFEIKTLHDYMIMRSFVMNEAYNRVGNGKKEFTPFEVIFKDLVKRRSNPQNNYYWAVVDDITNFLIENKCTIKRMDTDCNWDKDDVHKVNKIEFGIKSTTDLDIKEFCDFMENMFSFWIAKFGGRWQPKEGEEKRAFEEYCKNKKE